MFGRREFLGLTALGGAGLLLLPDLSMAVADTDRRFVFIILRGAADGLSIVAPVGDPGFVAARGPSAIEADRGIVLDSMFKLHPTMVETGKLYAAGQALFVHAVASPYRDRSHFDGQNVLETGGRSPFELKSGWMNRMLGLLQAPQSHAIAFAGTAPLALRGDVQVETYDTGYPLRASDALLHHVSALYEPDPVFHALWSQAEATDAIARELGIGGGRKVEAIGTLAARLLAAPVGPRIAMIESAGWDTHAQQRPRMVAQLKLLDGMIASLKAGLGPYWDRTMIVVATEFGRTVAINGTGGTDHGTASMAMLLGGAVKGGRVIADWPGLAPAALFQGRDLKPTTSLDSVVAGAVAGHFRIEPVRTLSALFPGSTVRASEGLVRA